MSKNTTKLISQGSFGCVYYPAINCKGQVEKKTSFATKIQKNSFSSLNEINIGKMIMKIPNYHFYFVPIIKSCPIKLKAIQNREQLLSKCNSIKNDNDNDKDDNDKDDDLKKIDYVLMTMPYIYTTDTEEKTETLEYMIDTYSTLVDAIGVLVDNKIVHLDLKSDNILYNVDLNIAQIIDFGISIPIATLTNENLKHYFYVYGPEYYVWPVEVHVINFLINNDKNDTNLDLTKEHIITIMNDIISNNKVLHIIFKKFGQSYIDMYREAYITYLNTYIRDTYIRDTYIGKSKSKIINELIKTYATWDNYSLSILFLEMLLLNDAVHVASKKTFIDNFFQLLIKNILPERYSIEDTKKKFKDLFYL